VGVERRLDDSLSRERRLREADFCVGARRQRLDCSEVEESMLIGVAVRASLSVEAFVVLLDSTTLIVGVDGLCASCFARPGECASICIGNGTPDLTQGLTVYPNGGASGNLGLAQGNSKG
jgi:hypothetical protein